MRQYGRRAGRCGGVVVLGLTLLVAILGGQVAVVSAQDVGGSDSASVDGSGSGSLALEAGVGASPSPTPTPAPTYVNDDCSACCQTSDDSASVMPACCSAGESLFSTNKGYCSGLPCCTYGGREAQGTNAAWYPCAIFPTCFNDESKKNFCTEKNFTVGAGFQCTDSCCSGPLLETNVWAGVNNAYPGNNNASFSVSFNPSELRRVFFNPGERDAFKMLQIVLASPPDYKFGKHPTCVLEKMTTHLKAQTTCSVDRYNGTTHLLFDIPEAFQTNETFTVTFDHVVTPTGVSENTSQIYAAGDNLAPVYFMFTSSQGYVFSTFYRVTPLQASSLTSGSFVPENIYPGNTGNATLSFYSNTQVAKNSVVRITFGSKWLFPGSPSWKWEVIPETEFAPGPTLDELLALEGSESGSGSIEVIAAPERAGPKDFSNVEYDSSSNRWYLTVSKEWQPGWIILAVDQVQNPAVAYSGLNLATIDILDSKGRTLSSGMFSAISVELVSEPIASPYNYVTIVVLIGTLLFCTVVIRGNGLSFSLGSIWTDITAICTVLALVTSIVNNLVWALVRSSVYFYISRIFLCFTFTMLTAVCFHWGTVLSLHLRRLPKLKTVIAFVSVNLAFYIFQAVFLFYHEGLIQRVYDSENDSYSYANQQCKDDSVETSNSVFSEIQGYLWSCYAENEDKFFLVSTTVTSALFLGLTVVVMALGLMVMRRGRLLVGNSTGPHQIVLIKALRLYYTLIGIVTIVYLLSWVVQLVSRSKNAISYPWFYIFTVWLPQSIPPCCLIFLQWNSTAKSLKDADYDPTSNSVLSEVDIYDEIRTPSFAFSSLEKWSDDETSDIYEADDRESIVELSEVSYSRGQQERPHNTTLLASTDDFIGLSMSLETNEEFPHGCFVAIQRLVVDPLTGATVWRQISNTDTAEATRRDFTLSGTVNPGRHVYSFMSVPRIPLAPDADDRVRLVVYSVNTAHPDTARPNHHSEMTAEAVLAAMERRSSGDDGVSVQTSTCDDSVDFNRSRVIDELFEQESEPDSTDGLNSLLTSLSIVAEFTVSTDVLVTSGARSEQVVLIAAEHSYKQVGLNSLPPKMSVHTVLPKAARTKYGLAGVASGLSMSHSISRQYHIRELGLLVVEDLTESRFSNLIPRQILEIILRYRSKQFLIAQNDLARLEAFDRQRQKGTDRGIYENLIQQIQDDGDISRCRDWMILRCKTMKDYIELLQRLRRVYVTRDNRKEYFKASTDKKNALLRFLPINLHLQDMWVGSASSFNSDDSKANVYDIVTVGAMAAHVYKFKNGGLLGLEEQRTKMKSRRREAFGSTAARRQSPMWTEEEQKAENLDWDIQKRMDVCFPQAVAALVTAFTRKIDLALQNAHDDVGREMLEHMEKLGFLFNVESLVSTHGNEAGMLEDMAGALNQLRNVRFVLVDEEMKPKDRDVSLSFDIDEEMKDNDTEAHTQTSSSAFDTNGSTTSILSGVVDVNVFSSLDKALADDRKPDGNLAIMEPPSPASVGTSGSSFSAVGSRLINTFIRAKSGIGILGGRDKNNEPSSDGLFGYTSLVIRVKVRTSRIKLPGSLPYGGTISVIPVLFTQGINEKQTIANNTGSAVTRLQDTINENSLKRLRIYADRYCNYIQVLRTRGTCPTVASSALSREQVTKRIAELDKLINSSKQARKKRPEILQLSSDLCRAIGAGRVTVCKSAKDRTGMSVTLEQGRILVQKHGLPESKKADIVSVMRSEGVRIENALKNTGRRVFAFNALQRSLLPEEYRCPPQTAGKNVS